MSYDGSLKGNAAIVTTSKVGTGALSLDGAGDYLDVTTMVDVNQPWAVSTWFRSSIAPSGTMRLFVFETSGGFAASFGLREGNPTTETGLQLYTDLVSGTDPNAMTQMGDADAIGNWHHILLSFRPPTAAIPGALTGYLNGLQSYNLTVPIGATLVAADGFHIGTYRLANDRWFNGQIDETAIWSRSLTAPEAVTVYNMGRQNESIIPKAHLLTLDASHTDRGTVTGRGSYDSGDTVSISATATAGYMFSAWEGDFAGRPAQFTHTVADSLQATALFVPDTRDNDEDGLSNYEEIVLYRTNPDLADTDDDGIPDKVEIQTTFTNPVVSDASLISFANNRLDASRYAGAIALEGPHLVRDAAGTPISLRLGLLGTADKQQWHTIDCSAPGIIITPAANGWNVTIPAPSSVVDSYLLLGQKP